MVAIVRFLICSKHYKISQYDVTRTYKQLVFI